MDELAVTRCPECSPVRERVSQWCKWSKGERGRVRVLSTFWLLGLNDQSQQLPQCVLCISQTVFSPTLSSFRSPSWNLLACVPALLHLFFFSLSLLVLLSPFCLVQTPPVAHRPPERSLIHLLTKWLILPISQLHPTAHWECSKLCVCACECVW